MEYSSTNPTLPFSSYSRKPTGKIEFRTVITLSANNWENSVQTVSVKEVTSTNLIFVSPTPESFLSYSEAVVRCISQSNGSLVFRCSNTPSSDLLVNLVIRK